MKKKMLKVIAASTVILSVPFAITSCKKDDKKSSNPNTSVIEDDTTKKPDTDVNNPNTGKDETKVTPDIDDEKKDKANMIALERLVKYHSSAKLDEKKDIYTPESWNAYIELLNQAKEVIEKGELTQQEVDELTTKIVEARNSLASVVQAASVSDIVDWLNNTGSNVVVDIIDRVNYSGDAFNDDAEEYTLKFTGDSFYDTKLKKGLTQLDDGFVHEFDVNEEGQVDMKPALLKEGGFPAMYLRDENMWRAVFIPGNERAEVFSYGIEDFGFYEPVDGKNYNKSDNMNFVYFFLGLTYGRHKFDDANEYKYSGTTIELTNNQVIGHILDDNGNSVYQFTMRNPGEASIPELASYKETHESYDGLAKYHPNNSVKPMLEGGLNTVNKHGFKLDIYTNRAGKSTQTPDYTMISKRNDEHNAYLSCSNGKSLLQAGGTTYNAYYNDGNIIIGDDSSFDLSDLNIVESILDNVENFEKGQNKDEYYINLTNLSDSTRNALGELFNLEDYAELAPKNQFGESFGADKSVITSYSIQTNDEGKLVISLWCKVDGGQLGPNDGLIARAVVTQFKDVTIPAFEKDYVGEAKKALSTTLEKTKDITNDDSSYNEESFKTFSYIRSACEAIIEKDLPSYKELIDANLVLESRYNELIRKDVQPIENAMDSLKKDIDTSANEGYKFTLNTPKLKQEFVVNSKYYHDLTNNTGIVKLDNNLYKFKLLEDGKVELGDPVTTSKGQNLSLLNLALNNLIKGTDSWGEMSDLSQLFYQVPNTTEYFVKDKSVIKNLGLGELNHKGSFSLEKTENGYDIYSFTKAKITVQKPVGIEDLRFDADLRVNKLKVGSIEQIGTAKSAELEAILEKNEALSTKEEVVALASNIFNEKGNAVLVNSTAGDELLVSKNYFFNAKTKKGFGYKDGKVMKVGSGSSKVKIHDDEMDEDFEYTIPLRFYGEAKNGSFISGQKVSSIEELDDAKEYKGLKTISSIIADNLELKEGSIINYTLKDVEGVDSLLVDLKLVKADDKDKFDLTLSSNSKGELVISAVSKETGVQEKSLIVRNDKNIYKDLSETATPFYQGFVLVYMNS